MEYFRDKALKGLEDKMEIECCFSAIDIICVHVWCLWDIMEPIHQGCKRSSRERERERERERSEQNVIARVGLRLEMHFSDSFFPSFSFSPFFALRRVLLRVFDWAQILCIIRLF